MKKKKHGNETSSINCITGVRSRVGRPGDRDGPKGDDPSPEILQDELLLRGHPALRRLQVERLQTIPARRLQVRERERETERDRRLPLRYRSAVMFVCVCMLFLASAVP